MRLEILRELFRGPGQSVSAIAEKFDVARPTATRHLRRLAARGLLQARRDGAWVYYRVAPDRTIPAAARFVNTLRDVFAADSGYAAQEIFRLVTAFTHPRRQILYATLSTGDWRFAELRRKTRMSTPALQRHLRKLRSRGFVVSAAGRYRAVTPPGRLARLLADLAPREAR
ncbi:MAG: ArsR family transcriptional regulator [Kiritimatiellae bacterium]|nr:ArsR family transcriptional regulator [Kiritimatiellia bacterium]